VQGYQIMLQQAKMACENQGRKVLQLMGKAAVAPETTRPEPFKKNGPVTDRSTALSYLNSGSNIRRTADILVALQATNLETKDNAKQLDVNLILSAKPNAYAEGFSDSLSQIGEYNEGTVTITASRPLANDQAEAEANKARAEHERAIAQRSEIMLNSEIGLTALYTNLKYLDKMLELNEDNLALAKTRLKLEKNKFNQGRSSVFFVLQAEDDALAAENNLNETLFAREEIINQIKSLTDAYLAEYKDILKL
jgi:outer membrane protein TolC